MVKALQAKEAINANKKHWIESAKKMQLERKLKKKEEMNAPYKAAFL